MMGILERLLGTNSKSSNVAKERLKLVLLQDRIKLPPPKMAEMQQEIVAVISKYIDIDSDGIELSFTQVEQQDCLVANIPVARTKNGTQ
ncbi:MAG: cell division topological specificity factor MinE [Chloroflexota bacterium]